MQPATWQLKQQMCELGHRIWLRGYCAGNEGNHSARIGDDHVLCTPTGISKGFLKPEDICVCDLDGNQVEDNPVGRKRSSEVLLHVAIYKARPDVRAVIHSHPPHATAFAVAGIPLPEGIHPEAEVFLGRVPTAPFAMPSTQDLPDSVVAVMDEHTNTVLMGNHGSVSFSRDLTDAYYKLEILDAYCRILLLCHQLGRANVLSPDENAQLLQVKQKFGMDDPRLECAPRGCVGEQNDPFFASFDVRPTTATCSCNGGDVATAHGGAGDADPSEALVASITDQIMAKLQS
ncbi:MAG: aldolase [Phycisphaeraceae bacterium]|nr:aldolase [Phycisphaeraceae bacterium]